MRRPSPSPPDGEPAPPRRRGTVKGDLARRDLELPDGRYLIAYERKKQGGDA